MENLYDEAKVIGVRIKNLRLRAGLTQEQLAKNIGVSQGTVAGWERGNSKPSVRVLKKLANELNISIERLTAIDTGPATPESIEAMKSLFSWRESARDELNLLDSGATEGDGKRIVASVKQMFDDSAKADHERQKAAEDAVGGDYLVYLANFLIQNADVLAMLQDAGYKIEVTGRASACIQSGPIKFMMTTSDLVERISRFSKTMEGLVSSFPEMRKEADNDAPQDNP